MTPPDAIGLAEFSELHSWTQDDHALALGAFKFSAQEILAHGHGFGRTSQFGGILEDWLDVCTKSLETGKAQHFFENEFLPVQMLSHSASLFTGYYEPQVIGSRTHSTEFSVPIYAKPNDLVAFDREERAQSGLNYGKRNLDGPQAYFTRKEIEQGALSGRGLEICFLKSWEDAYFIHIQGNGRILLPDGHALRLSFAGKNGHTYKSIGRTLLERGIGLLETMSMQFLRDWLQANPEAARKLMWDNPSFIFFSASQVSDEKHGAIGAAKVPLTPLRSLAVDRAFWAFGTPLYLSTHCPPEAGGEAFNQLMIAQDTGSAIKGIQRGDVYWGWGPQAELNAGHMKQPGKMIALLPKLLAERLVK